MQTLGIDLAASVNRTGVAVVEWTDTKAIVTDVRTQASDKELCTLIGSSDLTGIDCPLAWPTKFITFITEHSRGRVTIDQTQAAEEWHRALSYRETDLYIKDQVKGIQGLSVSSDRIGVTAMRCAALLTQLKDEGVPVDLTGRSGRVVEVYPAASLARWGLGHKGYKGNKNDAPATRRSLVDYLASQSWLELGGFEGLCAESDDALDAVLAPLTTRAAALRLVDEIPEHLLDAARSEGWIAVPVDKKLSHLVALAAR